MTKNLVNKRVVQRPTTMPTTRGKTKLGELYGPNSVGRHYQNCKRNGGRLLKLLNASNASNAPKAPRKLRKTPPIASKISFKMPGLVPCFGCTECDKNGKAFTSRTRPGVRLHFSKNHPELCETLPAIKKRAPRRLSPEQKLANKLKRKPRTTAYLDSYMHAV